MAGDNKCTPKVPLVVLVVVVVDDSKNSHPINSYAVISEKIKYFSHEVHQLCMQIDSIR